MAGAGGVGTSDVAFGVTERDSDAEDPVGPVFSAASRAESKDSFEGPDDMANGGVAVD